MNKKITQLTITAKQKMANSQDPIHDLNHVVRVVKYTKHICKEYKLKEKQKQALVLAAWWHDIGRTITKNPSLIWMPFFDDIISALILIKTSLFVHSFWMVSLSTRLILCKSLGTGAFFTKILLRKKDRILLDILKDADKLDILNPERSEKIHLLVEQSTLYYLGYKTMVWWFLNTRQLKLKTQAAKEYLKTLFYNFLSWFRQTEIYNWHINQFGIVWVQKNIIRTEKFLFRLSHNI